MTDGACQVDCAKEKLAQGNKVNLKSIEVFNCAAHVLQVTGRTTEADETLRNALEDDPVSISLITERMQFLFRSAI